MAVPPLPILVEQYREYLAVARGVSPNTLAGYSRDLAQFGRFYGDVLPEKREKLEAYMAWLGKHEGVGAASQARKLAAVRGFYTFLVERGLVEADPTLLVARPKLPQRLPKALSEPEVKALLGAAVGERPVDVRVRVMLILLYACGLRVSELVGLTLADVDDGDGILLRVVGKGNKTRQVPLGEVASAALRNYLALSRPHLPGARLDWVFPGGRGKGALTRQRVFQLVREVGERAGIKVAPHHLRHTFATHLLDHDADLRAVQLMLGHASLNTTQIYTKVADKRLKDALEAFHPLNRGK